MIQRYLTLVVCFLILTTASKAQTAFTWTGGTDTDWDDQTNWSPSNQGYPGQSVDDDTVTIPSTTTQPTLNVSVTIRKLTMADSGTDPFLTLNGGDLTIESVESTSLIVGANCTILIKKDHVMEINLDGDTDPPAIDTGHIELNGEILLGRDSDGGSDRPELRFGAGVYYTTGTGKIVGKISGDHPGILQGSPAVGDSWPVMLVLGPGNSLEGGLEVAIGLLNNGLVSTKIFNDDEDLPDPSYLILTCQPKGGAGDWIAEGRIGASGNFVVATNLNGTGDITVEEYGHLSVERHMTLLGQFLMTGVSSGMSVLAKTVFDVNRFEPTCAFLGGS